MGIPGILKEIGKGERVALSKLAIEHLERTNRPLRIAIDAAIWNFQNQAGQGGKNPALRTLFFKLLKLLALPIHPVFVYDGRNKPLTKRGKTVSRYGTCVENETARQLLSTFRFPHHTAPGEAEAECALLQKKGIVDAVMSQDVDAIMFGSTLTLRDWSKEGTKGNKTPTHVNVLDLPGIKRICGLDPNGMILVALLSGGDYDENGVPGIGSALACEIARAGFGSDLIELVKVDDQEGLKDWRDRLEYELQTNESGYFKKRHTKLSLPSGFPDATILGYYLRPTVSKQEDLPALETRWTKEWKSELDVMALRRYTASTLDWQWKSGARRFIRILAQPLFQSRLLQGTIDPSSFSMDHITDTRKHFTSDGLEELRLSVVPADAVGLDIEAEEDNPEYAADDTGDDLGDNGGETAADALIQDTAMPTTNLAKKPRSIWNPYDIEKWWIPQTLMQLGLPLAVEDWQQKQRDILMEPKKFAIRKCVEVSKPSKTVDSSTKIGTMTSFLLKSAGIDSSECTQANMSVIRAPRSPAKTIRHKNVQEPSVSIAHFFKPQKVINHSQEYTAEYRGMRKTDVVNLISSSQNQTLPVHSHTRPSTSESDYQNPKRISDQDRMNEDLPLKSHRLQHTAPDPTDKSITSANPNAVSLPASHASVDESELPNVTRRKKRQQKVARKAMPPAQSPQYWVEPAMLSLPEEPSTGTRRISRLTEAAVQMASERVLSKDIRVISSSQLLSSQLTVVSRDSLPGAWKRADAALGHSKRGPRVSYIDLTGD